MDKEKQKEYLTRIDEEIELTKAAIEQLKKDTAPVSLDASIGRVSRMDAINNKAVAESSLRNHKQKLQRLLNIKDRYPGKDFGHCIKCGSEIMPKRLMVMPDALTCVPCAQKG